MARPHPPRTEGWQQVKPSYAAELVAHLLAGVDDVAKVQPFAAVGAVGPGWPPHGVKVTYTDGTTIYLSSSRTSAPGEDLASQPDHFDQGDLHVPSLLNTDLSEARRPDADPPAEGNPGDVPGN